MKVESRITWKKEQEKCPICGGEGMTRKPLAMGSCDRCGGTGQVNKPGVSTEKPEVKDDSNK